MEYNSLTRVKDKNSLVVLVSLGCYRAYKNTTVERLQEIFPGKPIYRWDAGSKSWLMVNP